MGLVAALVVAIVALSLFTPRGETLARRDALRAFQTQARVSKRAGPFTAVDFRTARDGWVGGNGFILATTDGGRAWMRQHAGRGWILGFDFISTRDGWALLAKSPSPEGDITPGTVVSHALYATTDGGHHWRHLSSSPLISVDFIGGMRGWGVRWTASPDVNHLQLAPEGRLVQTNDGGRTWTAVDRAVPAQSVCFRGRQVGWVASYNSVLRTGNGGRTWRAVLRARVPTAGSAGVRIWVAMIHCRGRGVWTTFDWPGGRPPNADLYRAYRRSGEHWTLVFNNSHGPGNFIGPFVAVGSGRAYFTGWFPQAQFLAVKDGRRIWRHAVVGGLDFARPFAMSFTDDRRGWIAGGGLGAQANRGVILRTRNSGATWTLEYPPGEDP